MFASLLYDPRLCFRLSIESLVIALSRSLFLLFCISVISTAFGCRGGAFLNETTSPTFASIDQTAGEPTPTTVAETATSESVESQEDDLVEIVAELTELGALDEPSKAALLADLREADRENWPMIIKQFRSVLAYRKQLAAREQQASDESLTAQRPFEAKLESRPPRHTATAQPQTKPTTVETKQIHNSTPINQEPSSGPMEVARSKPRQLAAPVVLSKPPVRAVRPASAVRTATYDAQSSDWQTDVQRAVLGLQAKVQPTPGSPDEVNQHMRLRLLQLLAGDQDAALSPIPGATAPQQDYWNQQLFAVSTYLDSESQPDNKRRAAGSLTHLDHARAKLAELAMLQVRSLAFVESVDGFGSYELLEESKFRPGTELTLYAEIENFGSDSTQDGHRTRLGTSYEIVDGNGKRVDSAQFPEVEDLCKTKRRDFHMQYTITLPTRIYPDKYEIRLIVTDQQTHKIGQASLPFEIAE